MIKTGSLQEFWVLLGIIRYFLQLTGQLYPLSTSLYLLLSLQHAQVLLQAELVSRGEDGHIGPIASFLQLLLHLLELRMSSRHVYHIVLDLLCLIHLLDKGKN